MKVYNDFKGFSSSETIMVRDARRGPFVVSQAKPANDMHNARGLVAALLMSAACWAAIGMAFLL